MQVLALDTRVGLLLIPVSMVAQILASANQRPLDHRQSYVSNEISWREYSMPLINSSQALGATSLSNENYSRAVVLWPLKGYKKNDFFAFSSEKAPRVIVIEEGTKLLPATMLKEIRYAKGIIEVENQLGIIPDLNTLTQDIF